MPRRLALFCALLCASAAPFAQARADSTVTITEFGETIGQTGEASLPPFNGDGLVPAHAFTHVIYMTHSDQIVARLCSNFGVTVRVTPAAGDNAPDQIGVVIHHPLLTSPDGRTSTVDHFPSALDENNTSYAGFGFDNPWEVQPGQWTLDVVLDGQVRASKTFTVTLPQPGEPRSLCREEPTS